MTPVKTMAYIILPQAVRIVLPPVGNYAIGLLKDTSVCALIAAPELMMRAKDLASSDFQPMAVFVLAAAHLFRHELSAVARRALDGMRGSATAADQPSRFRTEGHVA